LDSPEQYYGGLQQHQSALPDRRIFLTIVWLIWLWDWESGESQLLIERGARPEWLP